MKDSMALQNARIDTPGSRKGLGSDITFSTHQREEVMRPYWR